MKFWSWLNEDYEHTGERFGYGKRTIVGFLFFLFIPILIYFLVIWDPIIGFTEEKTPIKLGLPLILGFYWLGTYFSYKSYERKIRLNRLLDKLLDKDKLECLFKIAKERQRIIKEKKYIYLEEGDRRENWF